MAATVTLMSSGSNNGGKGWEVWIATITNPTTAATVTATNLKSIDDVELTPMNAASVAAAKGYLNSFVIGKDAVAIAAAVDTQYMVRITGTQS